MMHKMLLSHETFSLDKAPKSKRALLYSIPAAATKQFRKESEVNTKTQGGGVVDKDARTAIEEHLTHEQAGWGTAPGYLIKKDGSNGFQKVKKSAASEEGTEEPKKVLEGLIKSPWPKTAHKQTIRQRHVYIQAYLYKLQIPTNQCIKNVKQWS